MKETLENLSKTVFEKQFRKDYESLDEEVRDRVAEVIEELVVDFLTEPWNHPGVKYISGRGEIWRLKIGSRGGQVDHRVFFDIGDDGLVFLAVEHRDAAYKD